jgi:hypothetical protein
LLNFGGKFTRLFKGGWTIVPSLHLSFGIFKYYGNTSNADEEIYFSPNEEFDHSANNVIENLDVELHNYDVFKGTTDEEEEYDSDHSFL